MEFNITEQKEFDTVRKLITNAPSGTTWRVLCYKPPAPKKTKNRGKSYAPGFTTASNLEEEEKRKSNSGTVTTHAKKSQTKRTKAKVTTNNSSGKKV